MRKYLLAAATALGLLATPTVASAESAVVTGNVNVRTGPGTNYSRVATVQAGSEVEILRCSGNWCQIELGRLRGWMSSNYLNTSGGGYYRPAPPPPAPRYYDPRPPYYDYDYDRPEYRPPYWNRPGYRPSRPGRPGWDRPDRPDRPGWSGPGRPDRPVRPDLPRPEPERPRPPLPEPERPRPPAPEFPRPGTERGVVIQPESESPQTPIGGREIRIIPR